MKAKVGGHGQLAGAIAEAGGGQKLDFAMQLWRMFSVGLPKVDATVLATAAAQWKTFWLIPSGMAAAIACLFFLAFWDRGADSRQ